jgi:hypothetical protein
VATHLQFDHNAGVCTKQSLDTFQLSEGQNYTMGVDCSFIAGSSVGDLQKLNTFLYEIELAQEHEVSEVFNFLSSGKI